MNEVPHQVNILPQTSSLFSLASDTPEFPTAPDLDRPGWCWGVSLIRKRNPLGPYCRPVPRVLGGVQGGWRFERGRERASDTRGRLDRPGWSPL